jgi:hypothetical protein
VIDREHCRLQCLGGDAALHAHCKVCAIRLEFSSY